MKNLTYEQQKAALLAEIATAFQGVSREGGVSLSESWVIDNYGSLEEQAEARRKDTELSWQEVPKDDICHGYSCLSFLDPIGLHYYIPAYCTWYITYMDYQDPEHPSAGSNTFAWLLYTLGSTSEDRSEMYRLFTPDQGRAIAHFLQFIQDCDADWSAEPGLEWHAFVELGDDAGHALERYWGKFLE
jgi:hypothetical protein